MKKIKIILIALALVTLSTTCLTSCGLLFGLDTEEILADVGDILIDVLDEVGDELFGSSYSRYDECEKGNHDWYYSWSEEPSCFYEGRTVYYCHYCGEERVEYIPMLKHRIVSQEGYEATCYSYGWSGSSWCELCGETIDPGYEIPPKGHPNTEIQNKRDVTCTQNGYSGDEVCLDCGDIITYGRTIYSNGHPNTYIEGRIEATCYESGYSGDEICSDCGEVVWRGYTTDPCHNNTTIINQVDATCTENGYSGDEYCYDCEQIIYYGGTIWSNGHLNYTWEDGKPATCTEDGYTEGQYCYACETYFYGHEVIPAFGHNEYIYRSGYEADCYNDGRSDEIWCSNCNNYVRGGDYIPAGHKEVILPASEPTCSSYGYTEGKKCTACGITMIEQQRIDMLKHENVVDVEGYDATCCSNGRTSGKICDDCGTPIVTQHTIPATGHVFGDNGQCYSCELTVTDCLEYSLNTYEDGYVVNGFMEGYGDNVSVLVIPSTYDGLPVTTIAECAFQDCASLTKVVIPDTVTYIYDSAFYGCYNITAFEFKDYEYFLKINTGWFAYCENAEIHAAVYNGKSPYEVYLNAMNTVNHNLNRYVMTTDGVTYMNYYGSTYKAISTHMIQKQYNNNFYIYNSTTDHMSSNSVSKEEFYYVNNYLYLPDYSQKWYCSPEAFSGMFLIESEDVGELTEKFFKGASFVVDAEGYMHLTLEMDEELIAALISEIGGISAEWNVESCTYSYKFDTDGNIISYTSDMYYSISDYDYSFNAVSTTAFSDVGTLSGISVPNSYNYTDYTYYFEGLCTNGHTIVECPEVDATCFANGKTAYSYCSTCYHAIEGYDIIPAGHDYVNGECTECGDINERSEGLAYELNEDGTGYIVVGIGDCKDRIVYIPQQIYGRPVVSVNADAFDNTNVYDIYIGGEYWYIDHFNGCDDATQYWNWD